MSTFTDALAALTPDELRDLVRTRPDAFFPTPPSPGALATRLALPGSIRQPGPPHPADLGGDHPRGVRQ